ncbi:uncharacterized protein DS421_13g414170 [Arachis hypogaea]|nr:uncharacterized protein DS421_13g414170 [Arachis hypogaea]
MGSWAGWSKPDLGNHIADDKSLAPSQPEEPEPDEEKYDEYDYSQLQACIENCNNNDNIRDPEKLSDCIEVCYKRIYD